MMLARLKEMSPEGFEELIGKLLGEIGFEEITQTSYMGDGGIDVRGIMVVGGVIRISMAVQAKRWKSNVQAPTVQQVRGSLGSHEQGLIITTSDFSSGARKEAGRANTIPVALMNGEQLVAQLVEHGIGVFRQTYDLLSLASPLPAIAATGTSTGTSTSQGTIDVLEPDRELSWARLITDALPVECHACCLENRNNPHIATPSARANAAILSMLTFLSPRSMPPM